MSRWLEIGSVLALVTVTVANAYFFGWTTAVAEKWDYLERNEEAAWFWRRRWLHVALAAPLVVLCIYELILWIA